MVVSTTAPRAVTLDTIEFTYADRGRALAGVALAHEFRRPRRIPFAPVPRTGLWRLELALPDADRMEYMLELRRRDGSIELVLDPANPLRARGPFGEKSVVELPTYDPPDWIGDEESPWGDVRPLALESARLRATVEGLLWSPADSDPDEPLPLLVAHDGPEYAEYSDLLRLLDRLVAFGDVPPLRAALLQPIDRGETYSASARYGRALTGELLPLVQETARASPAHAPVAMGASLGALALLHAHWHHPGVFGGLFLQAGAYFRERFDKHESGFPRFRRVTRFAGRVLAGRGAPPPIPITITCGTAEENLDNNRAVAAALETHGYDVRLVEHRDAHNWIAWRDCFHPHLAELMLRAWT